MNIDLRGKVAIVTGAAQGIGEAIAMTLAKEGVKVVFADKSQKLLDNITSEIKGRNIDGKAVLCDVRHKADVMKTVAITEELYGRIDILVNNAGEAPSGFVDSLDEESWDENMDVNLKGTFLCCQAVIPSMKRRRWGRIINAASFAAIIPSVGFAAYAASKAGVVCFTRVLAGELGPWNITANSYAPGMIPTQLNKYAEAPSHIQERLLNTLALRRWGEKNDIANLVAFLASDLSGYITGALIDTSGGKFAVQMPQAAYERAIQEGKSADET